MLTRFVFFLSADEILQGSDEHSGLVTLAFQEPRKGRSQRSLNEHEGWACPPLVQLPIC